MYGAMARLTLMGDILILLSGRSLINFKSPSALLEQGIRVRMHGTRVRHGKWICQPRGNKHVAAHGHRHGATLKSLARDNRLRQPTDHHLMQDSDDRIAVRHEGYSKSLVNIDRM